MSLTFNAIDVETANADRESICQIGITMVKEGRISEEWQTLVNPEDWFDEFNVDIHGIDEVLVKDSPTLPEIRGELRRLLRGSILVSHTSFDRIAFERAMKKYDLEQLQVTWLDSAKIVRRAWPEKFAKKGWGLDNVANEFGIEFNHHDALEDARVAAMIVLLACAQAKVDIEYWLDRVKKPIHKRSSQSAGIYKSESRQGNVEGSLFGEYVVFTGKLGLVRKEAADIAAMAGCNVTSSVSSKTTLLVVGLQDKTKLKGYEKSRKHRDAIRRINEGQDVQILSEADFLDLVDVS